MSRCFHDADFQLSDQSIQVYDNNILEKEYLDTKVHHPEIKLLYLVCYTWVMTVFFRGGKLNWNHVPQTRGFVTRFNYFEVDATYRQSSLHNCTSLADYLKNAIWLLFDLTMECVNLQSDLCLHKLRDHLFKPSIRELAFPLLLWGVSVPEHKPFTYCQT